MPFFFFTMMSEHEKEKGVVSMQDTYQFIGEDATFNLKNAENYSYLYFPVAGEAGIKSAVTPNLSGD